MTEPLIELYKGNRRKWLSLSGSKINLPSATDIAFFRVDALSSIPDLVKVSRQDALKMLGSGESAFVLVVRMSAVPLSLNFAGVVTDSDGLGWDFLLEASCALVDAAHFLGKYGTAKVTPETPASRAMLESWLSQALGDFVQDAIRDYSVDDLAKRNALPSGWWETRLNDRLRAWGLSFRVSSARWESADAARAEENRARQREMAIIEEDRQRQLEAELRETQMKTAYAQEKGRIEADRRLSESERAHRLQLLEVGHRKELLAAECDVEEARRAAERSALEHELAVARLRQDLTSVATAESRMAEVQKQNERLDETLSKASAALEKLGPILELSSKNASVAHQAVERLVSPVVGISPSALAVLGFTVDRQAWIETLTKRHLADGRMVTLSKTDLAMRDIGAAKVKALAIGRSLQFEIKSRRSGYLTALNLGTSGALYVHVPNAMIKSPNVRVLEGRSYFIPGDELFPWDGDYREEGPAGWEHIIGIVSDDPILDDEIIARSTSDSPIVELDSRDALELLNTLEGVPPQTWSAGILSFLVG